MSLACSIVLQCADKPVPAGKPVIVATTTHIATILSTIGGEHVSTAVLAQGGACPGHFDISPQHVAALERANMLIMHGWEQWAADVIEAAGNKELNVVKLETSGNAMVPELRTALAGEVAVILCKTDSTNCRDYRLNLETCVQRIADSAQAAKNMASPLEGVPVACSEHQKALLTWLGCVVVAAYGRAEDMTPSQLAGIEAAAREAHVRIVVDNLQSGPNAGQALARDIGAAHVALSNFPLNGSYEQTLLQNVRNLLSAVDDEK